MIVAEMRMICWICGHTRLDMITNEVIGGKIGVASIENKMREARLRWFGHIRRHNIDALVKRWKKIDCSDYKRSIGRPKKSWSKVISHDLESLGLVEDITQDRRLWSSRIKVMDF